MNSFALADHPTREDVAVSWLAYVTQDFPEGLFRGKKSAMEFPTAEAAEAYKQEQGLDWLYVRPLAGGSSLPPVGSRATVAPVSTVADYLHGQSGIVEEHRDSVTEGQPVAVIRFDVPVARHWCPSVPLETIGLRADQIA